MNFDLIAFLESQNEHDHKFSTYYVDSNTSIDDAIEILRRERVYVEKNVDEPSFILNNFNAIINSLLARDKIPEHGLVYFRGNGIFIEYRLKFENKVVTKLSTQGICLEPLKKIIRENTRHELLVKMKECQVEWCGARLHFNQNESELVLCEDCKAIYAELYPSADDQPRFRRQSATLE